MIHHTENTTTVKVGQSIATVIADTVWEGHRITTLELVYPRYIHPELLTHRAFSRNSSSSRATPFSVTIQEVIDDPVLFDFVGSDKRGMVAGECINDVDGFMKEWADLGRLVAITVKQLHEKYGAHKQTLNRALEPWSRIKTLVTATDFDNFFKLRLADDVQPEMYCLAQAMQGSINLSDAEEKSVHAPYIRSDCSTEYLDVRSVARCARVSYASHLGKETTYDQDQALYNKLLSNGHLSPFEHFANAKKGKHANLLGWQSLRCFFEENNLCDIIKKPIDLKE